MEGFFNHYKLHKQADDISEKFVKSPINKICRLCNKSYPLVSFDTIPHIVPELFGRNNLISNFECDECNKKFQKFESDAAIMVQHYLALLNIKTKNGVPVFQSFKTPSERSTILRSQGNKRRFDFGMNLKDFEFNDEKGSMSINFRTRNFRPFSIYKVFLKMGICLLTDEELKSNKHYLDFLNSEKPIDDGREFWTAFRYMLRTKYHTTPSVSLYKAKSTLKENVELPEYILLIHFANIVFQFFLPISSKNMAEHKNQNSLRLELFPVFALEDISRIKSVEMYCIDLKETKKVFITDNVELYYDKRISETKE